MWRDMFSLRRGLGKDEDAGPSGFFFGPGVTLLLPEECLNALDCNVFFVPKTITSTHHQFG